MARLPDIASLGDRPIPQARAPRTIDQSGDILADSIGRTANAVGDIATRVSAREDQASYAQARSTLLQADIATRKSLEGDQHFQTYSTRYREAMQKAREAASNGIRSRYDRSSFESESDLDIARGAAAVGDLAQRKARDVGRAGLVTTLDGNRTAALEASDEATRAALIQSTTQALDGAQANGSITAEEAADMRQRWVKSYGLGYLENQTPSERIRLLTKPEGTAAQYLAPDERQRLLKVAETEDQQNRIDGFSTSILNAYRRDGGAGDSQLGALAQSDLSLEDRLKVQTQVRAGLGLLNDERRRQYIGDISALERSITQKNPPADAEARAARLYRLGAYSPEQYTNVLQSLDRANLEGATDRAGMEEVRTALAAGLPLDPKSALQQKALDSLFKADTGSLDVGSPGWQAQASAYAGKTRVLPTAATTWARQTMRSPDPKLAAEGAQFFGAVQAASPDAVSEFDPDTKAFAGMINSMVESGTKPEKAAETARELVFNANPAVVKHRRELYENGREALAKQSDSTLDSLIDRDFDTWRTSQPLATAALSQDFSAQVGRYFEKTGDIALARDLAWTDMKRVYGVSRVNGEPQMMPMAPERFGITPDVVRGEVSDFLKTNPQADGSLPEEIHLVPDALTLRSLSNALDGKTVRPNYSLVTKTGDLVLDKDGVPLRYVLPVPNIDGQIRKAQEAAAAEVAKTRRVREMTRTDKVVREELARQGLDLREGPLQ